jgi:leader peptidase (prepilin peptidase)/N-methyltransferase
VTTLLAALAGVLGLAIGSFLNVVIWRIPRGESVVSPPSACPGCGTAIRHRDNVPVLGWLLLKGSCRDCREPISPRYPLVEAGTALLFVVMAVRFGADAALPAFLFLAAVGVALALIDLDVQRLPDALTLPSIGVTLVLLGLATAFGDHPLHQLVRAVIGAATLGLFYFAIWFAYPAGMGFGDVKLAPTLGACLGWMGYGVLVTGAFLGFLYGGLIGVAVVAFKDGGRKTKIPFGPFMLMGTLTAVLFGQDLVDAYLSFTLA